MPAPALNRLIYGQAAEFLIRSMVVVEQLAFLVVGAYTRP